MHTSQAFAFKSNLCRYATGAIAGALLFLEQGTALGTLTTASKSLVVAATPFGALFGALFVAPRFAGRLGTPLPGGVRVVVTRVRSSC